MKIFLSCIAAAVSAVLIVSQIPAQDAIPNLSTAPNGAPTSLPKDANLWGAPKIPWTNWENGKSLSAQSGKPMFVVVQAPWCPTCVSYRQAFHAEDVKSLSSSFIFVLIDQDEDDIAQSKFSPDGGYVPRTFIVGDDEKIVPKALPYMEGYEYFIDAREPSALAAGMRRFLEKN